MVCSLNYEECKQFGKELMARIESTTFAYECFEQENTHDSLNDLNNLRVHVSEILLMIIVEDLPLIKVKFVFLHFVTLHTLL